MRDQIEPLQRQLSGWLLTRMSLWYIFPVGDVARVTPSLESSGTASLISFKYKREHVLNAPEASRVACLWVFPAKYIMRVMGKAESICSPCQNGRMTERRRTKKVAQLLSCRRKAGVSNVSNHPLEQRDGASTWKVSTYSSVVVQLFI